MGTQQDAGQLPIPRLNLIAALIIGVTIKTMFILLSWYVIPNFVGPWQPFSHAYFEISLIIGAFLTGLAVGFLVRDQRNGALVGFLSAVLATTSLSVIISTTLHTQGTSMIIYIFSNLFFIIAQFPPDILALIGGAIGALLARRVKRVDEKPA